MSEAQTIPAKYIFLDVVSFTHNRSVEAQTDIVHSLNTIVDASIEEHKIDRKSIIFLPTGDGICIALLNIESPYDIHVLIALSIIKGIYEYNLTAVDDMRKFQVRIGINSNTDNLVTDINGNQNIAGAGINIAARIMSIGEGNQIFISSPVYEMLKYREKYMNAFKYHWKTVKHNLSFAVYQLISENNIGLNTEVVLPQSSVNKLPELLAYYFAHAAKLRILFLEKIRNKNSYEGKVLLWFLAKESMDFANASEVGKKFIESRKKSFDSIEERYKYIENQDFQLLREVSKLIDENVFPFSGYFEGYDESIFIKPEGIQKIKDDWENIYDEFNLANI